MLEWIMGALASLPQIGSDPAASVQAYSGATQAILTVALTPITIFAALMARNAWTTARDQRYDALMPLLSVTFANSEDFMAGPDFRVDNAGVGPALGVQAFIDVPKGVDLSYISIDQDDSHAEPVLIPAGKSHTFRFMENGHFSVLQQFGPLVSTIITPEVRKRVNRRGRLLEEANQRTRLNATPVTLRLTYRDVYGRRSFAVTVPLLPDGTNGEDDESRTPRFRLGQAQYLIPGRRDPGSILGQ